MRALSVKEGFGAIAALTGGLIALLFGSYTAFTFCGFIFLWSLLSLVLYFFENQGIPAQMKDAESAVPKFVVENGVAVLDCALESRGAISARNDCETDVVSQNNNVQTFVSLKADTDLCNN